MALDTFIVSWARCVLKVHGYFTLYYWAAKPFAQPQARSFWFVDVWVLSFFVLSLAAFSLSFRCANSTFQSAVIIFVIVRLWELVPYGIKVAIFTEPNKGTTNILDGRRSVIILLLNYAEMIFWFVTCYSVFVAKGQLKLKMSR